MLRRTLRLGNLARARSGANTTTAEIEAPDREPPREIRLVLRHAGRITVRAATVNQAPAEVQGETVVLASPRRHLRVACRY